VLLVAGCESQAVTDGGDARPDTSADGAETDGGSGEGSDASAQDAGPITLAFAGDVHFEGGLSGTVRRDDATLGPLSASLREADLAMVNLEAAITRRGTPAAKELEVPTNRFWFRTPPAALDVLARAGVDAVSVANNHGADYGRVGIDDTLAAAEDAPLAVLGVGRTPDEAFTPYRTTVRGTTVSLLAADASPLESNDPTWRVAPGTGPGLASARDDSRLVRAVRDADAAGDVVVVYLHWGEELASCPTTRQQDLARSLSDAGADVVVGTHAHVLQGSGTLGSTYVSYGLGNFFWYHGNQSETGVLQLTVDDGRVTDDTWVPGRIRPDGGNPQPLSGAAADAATADWRSLRGCTGLEPGPAAAASTPDDGLPDFETTTRRIGSGLAAEMRGTSWRRGCPVPLSDLRHVAMSYVGLDGQAHRGVMIVNADVVGEVQTVFEGLYEARFPLQQMVPIDVYGGDDNASMAANNTSGFNCRRVAGSTSWSDHAYGRAVDINPVQNPYVLGDTVLPPAGREYVDVDRSRGAQVAFGVIRRGDVAQRAFTRLGWGWGGDYAEPDYQHFSQPGA
jgi:poly-gamma-glutamate synthesis protein (capsule biosynthesis protein)